MKKVFLIISLFVSGIILSGCQHNAVSVQKEEPQVVAHDATGASVNQETYLSGYMGAVVVITQANSGDIVTQTGDELLYRNELYGFQILLTKKAKGVKIKNETVVLSPEGPSSSKTINSHMIRFYWPASTSDTGYEEGSSLSVDYPQYRSAMGIQILDNNIPNPYSEGPGGGDKLGSNNHFYFLLSAANADHTYLSSWIPTLTCKDITVQQVAEKDCSDWITQLMTGFTTFDVK